MGQKTQSMLTPIGPFKNSDLLKILSHLDLGSSIAEQDTLLEDSRIETSAFSDLFDDKVDLIPGTKGSGKSALFRIFTDFLPERLLYRKKVVIAHGVHKQGDTVFHAFRDQFEKLSEDDFVEFWCIYFVSLAHEQFIKGKHYQAILSERRCGSEVENFRQACMRANIPEIKGKKTLKQILEWALAVLKAVRPKIGYELPQEGGTMFLSIFDGTDTTRAPKAKEANPDIFSVPNYLSDVKESLEDVLTKCDLCIWLMVDRLDELFPRRSDVETRALRGLLRVTRVFSSERIRIKMFLRDDMLEQIVSSGQGFTALTHVTARQADTLRWTEDQIMRFILKRVFYSPHVGAFFSVNPQFFDKDQSYRELAFYRVFPKTVHRGSRQSSTLRWIYSHAADGKSVVTPRDILDLLMKAKQKQQDLLNESPTGFSPHLFDPSSLRHGFEGLSLRKRVTYLEAEFPHLWPHIKKFIGGKSTHSELTLERILGKNWLKIAEDLISIGVLTKTTRAGKASYSFPDLYLAGLELTRGKEIE
jgi:hypothetical protein